MSNTNKETATKRNADASKWRSLYNRKAITASAASAPTETYKAASRVQPAVSGCFIEDNRFISGTKNFGKQIHAELSKYDADQPKPKCCGRLRLAQIACDTRTKNIGQRSEEQVKRTR